MEIPNSPWQDGGGDRRRGPSHYLGKVTRGGPLQGGRAALVETLSKRTTLTNRFAWCHLSKLALLMVTPDSLTQAPISNSKPFY